MAYISRNDLKIEKFNLILFFGFSFLYLLVYQTDIERMAHPEFTGDVNLVFHPLLLSAIFASLVTGSKFLCQRLLKFRGMWDGCNYLAPALLLAANTAYDSNHIMGHSFWAWIAILFVAALAIIAMRMISSVARQNREDRMRGWSVDMPVMTVVLLVPCLLSNSDEQTHRELAAARYLTNENYERVLSIGKGAEEVTTSLSLSRARAMVMVDAESAPEGSMLGEMMFLYPLPYPRVVSNALQDTAYHGARRENCQLTSKLLLKEISSFAHTLESPDDSCLVNYSSWKDGSFPVFYLQAVLLNDSLTAHKSEYLTEMYPVQTSEQQDLFAAYCKEKAALEGQPVQYSSNSMKKRFGKTYWWFYDFQN